MEKKELSNSEKARARRCLMGLWTTIAVVALSLISIIVGGLVLT